MNTNINIETLLAQEFPNCTINVFGEHCNFTIEIVGEIFQGKSRLERQRLVNRVIHDYLKDGTIHAVSIIAKTPGE